MILLERRHPYKTVWMLKLHQSIIIPKVLMHRTHIYIKVRLKPKFNKNGITIQIIIDPCSFKVIYITMNNSLSSRKKRIHYFNRRVLTFLASRQKAFSINLWVRYRFWRCDLYNSYCAGFFGNRYEKKSNKMVLPP